MNKKTKPDDKISVHINSDKMNTAKEIFWNGNL